MEALTVIELTKRLQRALVVTLGAALLNTASQSQGPVPTHHLSTKALRALDLYLSNFAEAEFAATDQQFEADPQGHIMRFAVDHATWNGKGIVVEPLDGPLRLLSAKDVEAISRRYFGRSFQNWKAFLIAMTSSYESDIERRYAAKGYAVAEGLEPQFAPRITRVFRVSGDYPRDFRVDAVEFEPITGEAKSGYRPVRFVIYHLGLNLFDKTRHTMRGATVLSREAMGDRLNIARFPLIRYP